MKKILYVLIIFGAALSCLQAENLQKLYEIGDPVYTEMKAIYLDAGMAPPSSSGPWTSAEILQMLDRIDRTALSAGMKDLLDSVRGRLDTPDMSEITFQGSLRAYPILELYMHTNPDDYTQDEDWVYDYDARKPLVDIPVETFMTDYIYGATDFAILKNRFGTDGQDDDIFSPAFSTNFPFDEAVVNHLDLNFPERAVASIGMGQLNLSFGRDDLLWGSGHTGSMTVGDHLDYYEFVRFMSFHDNFKYTAFYAGFDSPSWTNPSQNSTVDDNDTATTDDDNIKLYAAHRFEFRWFGDRVNFNLTEGMIYQGSTIDFRYLSPTMFWHDQFIRGNANSTLALELEVNPWRYINTYATVLLDEFPYPGEDQTAPGAHPNGIGILGGVETLYPLGPGILTGWVEYVHTDPYLYLRDNVDYIVNRRVFNMIYGFGIDRNFMGYEYGNDVIVLAGGFEYDWADILSAELSLTSIQHGEFSMDTDWEKGPDAVNATTPYDDPLTPETVESSLIVTAGIELYPFRLIGFDPLDGLGLSGSCSLLSHTNKDNIDGSNTFDTQITVGMSYSY